MRIPCEIAAAENNYEFFWHSPDRIESPAITSPNIGEFYPGTGITGTAYGTENSFCNFPASAYRSGAFEGIWKFSMVINGTTIDAYCLEKGIRGPNGNPYASVPVDALNLSLDERQRRRIAYILANAFPVISVEEQFANAGIPSGLPALDANDAYAATQIAIWSVINEPADQETGWSFFNCSDGALHPKSARLQASVASLFNRSALYADRSEEPGNDTLFPCCKSASIDGATLVNCGGKRLHKACEKWLYGPLMVRSAVPFSIFLTPICEPECLQGFITLADTCGTPILHPASGQEFYIAFPPSIDPSCYEISIGVTRTVVDVVAAENTDGPPHLQALIFTPRCRVAHRSASLCFCVAPKCPPEPCPTEKGFPCCFVNNNYAVANSGARTEECGSSPERPCSEASPLPCFVPCPQAPPCHSWVGPPWGGHPCSGYSGVFPVFRA